MSPASRRGPATAARWGLISSFESRGGNRAAPGPPPSPEWRGRPQRRAHPGNRHRTRLGDTGRRDRGSDRGNPAPPSQAGRAGVHPCSPGLLPSPEEEEEGRPSAPRMPGDVWQGLSPPAQPHKGLGELCWHLGTRVGVQGRVCVCVSMHVCTRVCVYLYVRPSVCASVVCGYLWLCLVSTGLCMHVNAPVRIFGYVPHASVCASPCVSTPLCAHAHAHPPCVSVCAHTRECLRLSFPCFPPFPHHFVLLRVCRGLARGPSPGAACPPRRCEVISRNANYSPDQKPFRARTGCLAW